MAATEEKSWDLNHAARIGEAVKALRGDRSAQWLSDRTEKAGHKISRSTITDIENRRRKYVSTAELCVLAWALNVPPVRLLYPDLPDGLAEIVPGVTLRSFDALEWFAGERIVQREDLEAEGLKPYEGMRVLHQIRYIAKMETRRASLAKLISEQVRKADTELIEHLTGELERIDNMLDFLRTELREEPGVVISDGG